MKRAPPPLANRHGCWPSASRNEFDMYQTCRKKRPQNDLVLFWPLTFDLLPFRPRRTQGSWRRRWRIRRWPTSLRNRSTSSDTESSSCPANWSLYPPRTSGTHTHTHAHLILLLNVTHLRLCIFLFFCFFFYLQYQTCLGNKSSG